MKMCLIGCGGMSSTNHGPSYLRYRASNSSFVMAACSDLDPVKLEAYRAKFGFERAYTDYRQMIETEKPDAVCVIVTEAASATVGHAVLDYGIPMLIEKPPGKTSGETLRLVEAAQKHRVPHLVAFNRRFIPLMKVCRAWLDELGGAVYYAHYEFFRHGRNDEDFSDTAIHAIDAVRYLTGADYAQVRFHHQDIPGKRPANVYMDAAMTNGAIAHIHVCPDAGVVIERATLHIGDTTIMLHLPIWNDSYDLPGSIVMLRKGQVVRSMTGDQVCDSSEVYLTNGFYEENKVFFDAVQSGAPMPSSLKEAYQTMLVKEAYAEKAATWSLQD